MKLYPWHSINLIPVVALIPVCSDEYPHRPEGSLLEVCAFGYVLHVDIPFNTSYVFATPVVGPLWSKKRKLWYTAAK